MCNFSYILLGAISLFILSVPVQAKDSCHYKYTVWNTLKKTTIKTVTVSKSKSKLSIEEIGPFGCTPCLEDQSTIHLSNNQEITVCKHIAKKVQTALNQALNNGAKINTIKGYRASKSRGPIDKRGNRTVFSNHAYGIALDINENQNGLYYNCSTWSTSCSLRKGGRYNPKNPLSLTKDHLIVTEMKKQGLLWGGELNGSMKDFMHFSPDGS